MPLNLSNRDQNSGHLFYNRRLRAAITRFSVRMKHDDRKQQAALALSMVLVLIGVGWMALLHVVKPAGLVGESSIIGDRDTGTVYAKIDGRLHPALNLTSARLAVGTAATPTWVRPSEIAKYPTVPMIGIPGLPGDLGVTAQPTSAWSVCDTAAVRGRATAPTVTSIAGELPDLGRATPLGSPQAILATHKGVTYVIWGGHRSAINLADRAVTFNLGLDPGLTRPIPVSNALFDAIPATEPLSVPRIPDRGAPSRWIPYATVGTILQTRNVKGAVSGFYVLLTGGLQKITSFVADLLRTANAGGPVAPRLIGAGTVIDIPAVDALNVDYYPRGRLSFVDTAANPVTCVEWRKQTGDPQASITVLTGRGLPVPIEQEPRLVKLVRDNRATDSVEADQTLVLPGAANLIATTSGVITSDSRESLYWVSPQGVRYGIQLDAQTLQALEIDPGAAVQAPWPIVRTFAPGPAISRGGALLEHDTVAVAGAVAPVTRAGHGPAGG
jgi:type VII secretion protein EccB